MRLLHRFALEKVAWKILHSDWLRAFWPVSQEQDFCQIWDLCRNKAYDINFHYRTYSVKINDFGPFPQFWEQKLFFQKKPVLQWTNSWGFPTPCQNSGKTNDPVQGKCPDRQKDRKTNRPYFIGTFQLTLRVQQVQLL